MGRALRHAPCSYDAQEERIGSPASRFVTKWLKQRRRCRRMKHTTSRMLFAHWNGARGERASPERCSIDPGAIRHILADTFILEAGPNGAAAFRLAGTRLCALFGRELKGQPFESLWTAREAPQVRRSLNLVTHETVALVSGHVGAPVQGDAVDLEMLLLPLRERGKTHALALGAVSLAKVPAWLGYHPISPLETVSQRVVRTSSQTGFPLGDGERPRLVVHRGGRA